MVLISVAAAMVAVSAIPFASPSPLSQEAEHRVRVSKEQLLAFAETALSRGDLSLAITAFQALAKDPEVAVRSEARFRLAMLRSSAGDKVAAATLLRAIVDEQPRAQRARLELARVLVDLGDIGGAQRQLRALHSTRLPPQVSRLVSRYAQRLRASQPTGAAIEVALAPDSNISRSTHSDTLDTIFGDFDIAEDSKARSGLGLSVAGQAFRRFELSRSANLALRASTAANLYGKSRFNDVVADLAAASEVMVGRNRLGVEVGASHYWFGQKPFMRSVRIGATWTRLIDGRTQARLSGTARTIDNRLNDLQDGRAYSLELAVERALSETAGLSASLSGERQALEDPGYATKAWRVGLFGWRDLNRVTVSGGVEFGALRADERLLLFPQAREDRYRRLSIGMSFRDLSVRGFSPLVRIIDERNRSSVELYDYRRRRTELAIVRSF